MRQLQRPHPLEKRGVRLPESYPGRLRASSFGRVGGDKGGPPVLVGGRDERTTEPSFGMKFLARKTSGEEFDTGEPEEIRFPGKSR